MKQVARSVDNILTEPFLWLGGGGFTDPEVISFDLFFPNWFNFQPIGPLLGCSNRAYLISNILCFCRHKKRISRCLLWKPFCPQTLCCYQHVISVKLILPSSQFCSEMWPQPLDDSINLPGMWWRPTPNSGSMLKMRDCNMEKQRKMSVTWVTISLPELNDNIQKHKLKCF